MKGSESDRLNLEVLKEYAKSTNSFIQLSSAGIALPLALGTAWAGIHGQNFRFPKPVLIEIIISWAAFIISIGAAALYQYAAIKFFEKSVFPEAYVPAVLRPLMKKGPGEAYGIMVACFSIGGIFILVYSYTLVFLTK